MLTNKHVLRKKDVLAANDGFHLVFGFQHLNPLEEQQKRSQENKRKKHQKRRANLGLGEGVDRIDDSGARQEGPQDGEGVGENDQHHIPDAQHVALFLNHHGV